MRASGQHGELRYGYQIAARTGAWIIEAARGSAGFTFDASLVEQDEIWLSRRPLDLVLALGPFEWIWRDVAPIVTGQRVEIALMHRPDIARPRAEDPVEAR